MKNKDGAYVSDVLLDAVHEFDYKPGWMQYIEYDKSEDGSGGWTLFIVSNTENSLKPGERIRVAHPFLIPPASYNLETWLAWIFERCCDVERHEAGEFFKFRGVRVFAPHHGNGENPYVTWHISDYATASKKAGND